MDSDSANWQRLRLTEQGGFAGLLRGADMLASELPPELAQRVARLLGQAKVSSGGAADYPDGQTLSLEVQTAAGPWTAHFDSADLPQSVDELKGLLTLKPIAPR